LTKICVVLANVVQQSLSNVTTSVALRGKKLIDKINSLTEWF